ncbi:MAG: ABC transporter permease [Acidimicrobiales bacterium]
MAETTSVTDTASASVVPTTSAATGLSSDRLPGVGTLLAAQVRYQARLVLASGRSLAVGFGLPVILLVASHGKGNHPNVAGYAVFGLTIIVFTSYGVRLIADREAGILKRWRATPLPRWCYFLGRILATALVGVMAGAVTVAAAGLFYGSHLGDGPSVHLTGTAIVAIVASLILGALAWAAVATALSSIIPTVDAAAPILMLTYFPVVIISGVLGTISEPHWLATLATYLPAQPLIDALVHTVHHAAGAALLPIRDVVVLASWAVGGLLAASILFRWEPHRPTRRRVARGRL